MPDYARTTRTARTTWSADLEGGSGEVQLTSSRTGSYPITYYGRTAEDADGATSPEELLAAAYTASCAMQLTSLVAQAGGTPEQLDLSGEVELGADPAGGFRLARLHLTVRGRVAGLDAESFALAAEAATRTCPLSKALTGVRITLDAALGS